MNEKTAKSLLTAIGISGGAITLIFGISIGFTVYKNYYEVKKLKLDIANLEKLLGLPITTLPVNFKIPFTNKII
jgi:hypothetical protein